MTSITVFDAEGIPEISIKEYIQYRLMKYMECSEICYLVALVYLEKINITIDPHNIHRCYLSAIIIAAKLYDDIYYSNYFYSVVGGVSLTEVNRMEIEMLRLLEWKTYVHQEEIDKIDNELLEVKKLNYKEKNTVVKPRPKYNYLHIVSIILSMICIYYLYNNKCLRKS